MPHFVALLVPFLSEAFLAVGAFVRFCLEVDVQVVAHVRDLEELGVADTAEEDFVLPPRLPIASLLYSVAFFNRYIR